MSPLWFVLALLPALAQGERFSCKTRILGGYYADVKAGCRAFYVCVRVAGGGIRSFRFLCPPGTLFQQEAQTCTDWGDDDGLACPAELYDGSFDLYKIGSGFDTKKTDAAPQREDDDFALQRAETGDRRLNQSPSSSHSDLRASHSSDFFSGRRDRGRDDFTDSPSSPQPSTRAPYRRPPPRASHRPTTYAPQPTFDQTSPAAQHEHNQKRKLVRKRPIHAPTTAAPSDFTTSSKQYFRSTKPDLEKSSFTSAASTSAPIIVNEDSGFVDVIKVSPKVGRYNAPNEKGKYVQKTGLTEIYNYNAESTPNYKNENFNTQNIQHFKTQIIDDANNANFNQASFNNENNFKAQNNANNQNNNRQNINFKNVNNQNSQNRNFNEPKNNVNNNNNNNNFGNQNNQINNLNNQNNFNGQKNFETQNTNNFDQQNLLSNNANIKNQNPFSNNENNNLQRTPLKATLRNSFNVAPPPEYAVENEVRKSVEVSPNGVQKQSSNFENTRFAGTTPAFRNFNSVSFEDKKVTKQNFASSTTPKLEITRPTAPSNINPVAYNTNNGFDTRRSNFAHDEDDGQYRLPSGEDDGQYRPELYERESELLSGAHSLNIAASKNQIQDHQKQRRPEAQTSAPRPFSASTYSPKPTETQYPTTQQLLQNHRAEYHQQYQTTSRNQQTQQSVDYGSSTSTKRSDFSAQTPTTFEYDNSVFTTSKRPITPFNAPITNNTPRTISVTTQQLKHEQVKPHAHKHKPTSSLSKPLNPKEDASYDYAYYDTDSGFSEYDQIEEFEKTKKKA